MCDEVSLYRKSFYECLLGECLERIVNKLNWINTCNISFWIASGLMCPSPCESIRYDDDPDTAGDSNFWGLTAFIQILFAMHIGFYCWSTLWNIFKICKNASISKWEISENKDHEGLNLKKLENMISW